MLQQEGKMFQSLENKKSSRSIWTIAASFTGEIVFIGALLLVPLIWPESLPRAFAKIGIADRISLSSDPPLQPLPPRENIRVQKTVRKFDPCAISLCAPSQIPTKVVMVDDGRFVVSNDIPGVQTGSPDTPPSLFSFDTPRLLPPPSTPPSPPKPAAETKKEVVLTVGGKVQEANILKKVMPAYPPIARQVRVQGIVQFSAMIDKDGSIRNLQLVSGHPLLVDAARIAVSQWVYKPTLLNGEPVAVITDITVRFTLTQ